MLAEPTQRHHIVVVPDHESDVRPPGWTGDVTLECLADLVQLLSMAQTSGAPASRRAIRSSFERISRSRIVELEGHADADGSSEINQRISENRAAAVQAYLTGTGIKPESIRIRAVGETQASGTALDRRVEIWIEP
ncbi:MAG TPA: OmpA family protein [Polyangiales bacterium]|nr:OmpA family protein [Polyangiales bacterium]